MTESIRAVRLHRVDEGTGHITDLEQEFDLDELAGELPAVGDLIVEPGVLGGLDRGEPANREVYEVVGRYFLPGAHGKGTRYVGLVVKVRRGTDAEASIVCVS